MSSLAIAGTTKAITGRSRWTVSNHRPASNLGRYSSVMPAFIGL